MVTVITYGCCTNERNSYNAKAVNLVLDTPAYEKSQFITTIYLSAPLIINRVNRVEKNADGYLTIHIA